MLRNVSLIFNKKRLIYIPNPGGQLRPKYPTGLLSPMEIRLNVDIQTNNHENIALMYSLSNRYLAINLPGSFCLKSIS